MRKMLRICCAWALCLAVLLCLGNACAATLEISLAAGEEYVIPEGRRGEITVDDESVVRAEGYTLKGLRPGRTAVHVSGTVSTDYAVLVLFSAQEETEAASVSQNAAPDDAGEAAEAEPDEPDEAEEAEPDEPDETADAEPDETDEADEAEPDETDEADEAEPDETDEASQALPGQAEDDSPAVQHYDRSAVPALINQAVDLAFTQWEEDAAKGTKKFSRLGKYNKYSYWQCGSGSGCDIGWCGAFLGYVFDNAGVPMDKPADSVVHEGGVPYSVRAAGVGKIWTGFSKMERLSSVPRPGYFVVYGQQKGYAYKHIGLVVDADDLGGGQYLIKTIEGNMSSTIRRYCYLYDSTETVKNLKPCPEEYVRDDEGINAYEHVRNWNITAFCQTWDESD